MKSLCLCILFLLVGCGLTHKVDVPSGNGGWPIRQLDSPPSFGTYPLSSGDQKAFETYVIDVNAYAYYVYNYAHNLNEYAKLKGWKPPKVVPLCEEFDAPDMHPIPSKITLDRNSRSPEQISLDLTMQFKTILANYRSDRQAFRRELLAHRKTCLF